MNHTQYIRTLIFLLFVLLTIGHSSAPAQVLHIAELNTEQIRDLDKEKTIVLIPGGILEQHGPYLPSYTDGYRNEWAAGELSRAIAVRPGWTALVFPTIPLGVGGANEIGGIFSFPGTYAVRSTTLRAIFVDLANELGEQGFKWIFVVHLHGAPAHSRVLDEAGDYFRDIYGGRMVHLYGLLPVLEAGALPLDPAEATGTGLDIHAGRGETSDILFIRPDLVASGYQTAPPLPGFSFDDLVRIAQSPDWPGYFSAPGQATAAEGKARLEQRTEAAAEIMWRIVEGTADEREIPRFAMNRPEASLRAARAAAAEERVREKRFAEWLAKQGESSQSSNRDSLPIIDMHLHAVAADHLGPPPLATCTPMPVPAWDPNRPYHEIFAAMHKTPPCPDPVWSPETDDELMSQTIEVMERLNIVGVLSGHEPDRIATWMAAAPERFIPGLVLRFSETGAVLSTDSLRGLHSAGRLAVLGEVVNQYAGITPDDERMRPYWELAEELDIPVGIHVGTGPPGVIYLGSRGHLARLNSPLTMEEVLIRHPRLRVYLMHAGYPMLDDLLAVLYAHPQVYVDVGIIVYQRPRPEFYRYLRAIVEAGYGNRVMFGSDQMVWPGAIERAVEVIREAPFLSEEQKRDILYNNAARFLRLSEDEIAKHHSR